MWSLVQILPLAQTRRRYGARIVSVGWFSGSDRAWQLVQRRGRYGDRSFAFPESELKEIGLEE